VSQIPDIVRLIRLTRLLQFFRTRIYCSLCPPIPKPTAPCHLHLQAFSNTGSLPRYAIFATAELERSPPVVLRRSCMATEARSSHPDSYSSQSLCFSRSEETSLGRIMASPSPEMASESRPSVIEFELELELQLELQLQLDRYTSSFIERSSV
jgi:hypothetical protein